MMNFMIESIIVCIGFSALIVLPMLKNPLVQIQSYPPAIGNRAIELGLVAKDRARKSKKTVIIKSIASLFFVVILTVVVYFVNGARTFLAGFGISYLLWMVVNWYDALVLDCLLFCHCKRFVLPGTEDMVKEYHDYWFHIKGSMIGMMIGLPVCLLTGACTILFTYLFG